MQRGVRNHSRRGVKDPTDDRENSADFSCGAAAKPISKAAACVAVTTTAAAMEAARTSIPETRQAAACGNEVKAKQLNILVITSVLLMICVIDDLRSTHQVRHVLSFSDSVSACETHTQLVTLCALIMSA